MGEVVSATRVGKVGDGAANITLGCSDELSQCSLVAFAGGFRELSNSVVGVGVHGQDCMPSAPRTQGLRHAGTDSGANGYEQDAALRSTAIIGNRLQCDDVCGDAIMFATMLWISIP